MARFLQRTIESLLHREFAAESLPVIDATFERTGNSLGTVEERVASGENEIILSHWDLMPLFVLTTAAGAMNRPLSVFLPARGAQLSVNGEAATAKVFIQGPLRQAGVELLPGVVGDVDETEGVNAVLLDLKKAPGGDDGPRGSSAGGSGDWARRSDCRSAARCRFLLVWAHFGNGGQSANCSRSQTRKSPWLNVRSQLHCEHRQNHFVITQIPEV